MSKSRLPCGNLIAADVGSDAFPTGKFVPPFARFAHQAGFGIIELSTLQSCYEEIVCSGIEYAIFTTFEGLWPSGRLL
jgi:hypothetical protein